MSLEDDLKKFDHNLSARLLIGARQGEQQLDVAVAQIEKEQGIPHVHTSKHGQKVYDAQNPAAAKPLARALINEGGKTAEEYLTDDEALRRLKINQPKAERLIDHALSDPHTIRKLSEQPGDFTRREAIREAGRITDPNEGPARGL